MRCFRRPPTSAAAAAAEEEGHSSVAATISLSQEYTLTVQTNSYNEIWSNIHHRRASGCGPEADVDDDDEEEKEEEEPPSAHVVIARVLQPDRQSIDEALRAARPTKLTRLVSNYLDTSEYTSHLFLSLGRSIDSARSLYGPIAQLLDLVPSHHLSPAQCDWVFDTFLEFDRLDNPFAFGNGGGFDGMRTCFSNLKQHLDLCLLAARRRHRLLRRATVGSAACLIGSVAGAAIAGLAIATHALAALVAAGPAFSGCLPTRDLVGTRRQRLRERMTRLDAAARGAYVLDNHLDTIERLVTRLHATVESDKVLVRLGLDRGRAQRHSIEEVLRQLRKNHPVLLHQLTDLDEHVCLCFAAINRARSLLFQQIHHHHS